MSAVLGAVLAGGRGSRLGGDKPGALLAGRPLVSYPVAAMLAAGLETVVVAKPDTSLPRLEVRVVHERQEPLHPLAGIIAALRHANGRPVLVVGADMPMLSARVLRPLAFLVPRAPLLVPRACGDLQPLCARYAPSLMRVLEAGLHAEAPLRRTIEALDPLVVEEGFIAARGDPGRLLFNVNTPEDLTLAAKWLRG